MKKYILTFSIVLVLIICVCGIVFAGTIDQDAVITEEASDEEPVEALDEEALLSDLIENIEAARIATCYGPESVTDDSTTIVESVDEAEQLLDEYEDSLDELFTTNRKEDLLRIYESYPEEVETREERIEDSNQMFSEFTDFGCFDTEILDYTVEDDTAVLTAVITVWAKSISQYSEVEFAAIFPVNKYVERIEMIMEDGAWKVNKEEMISTLLMEGDYDLERTFGTYEEAVAYAMTVTPKNVLADVTVKPYE